jgi:hypothetical protein
LVQADCVKGAPQWVQNLPEACLPQPGQVVFDAVSFINHSISFGSARTQ